MTTNFVMTKEFDLAAKKAVKDAVKRADDLGLPKAYIETTSRPEESVIVVISGAKKDYATEAG